MSKSKKISYKQKIVNFFGYFGYFVCFLHWFWAIIQYFNAIESIYDIPTKTQPIIYQSPTENSPIFIIVAITVAMVIISIYVAIKLPFFITESSAKIVQSSTDKVAPLIIKSMHKKVTKKAKLQISANVMIAIKIILVILPIIVSAFAKFFVKQEMDYATVIYISLALAFCSGALFFSQYILAKLFNIKKLYIR